MNNVEDIFIAFQGTSAVAAAVGLNLSTASEMRRRGSIPVRYWPRLVDAAQKRNLKSVSYDLLVAIHAVSRKKKTITAAATGAA